ncbi:pectin lyase fold/virulence factor [Mycena vulgaris]|nr:pectin lyase fold/virulence factor [Mycena vulgaris]
MRLTLSLLLALSGLHSVLAQCTVSAAGSGKDDSPQLLTAMQTCSTVVVPVGTTLNISTRLNMTGLSNKHLNLQGTMRFNPNIAYWTANGFPFSFQTQITFWILGGTNLVLDGGGTLDGAGQLWYDTFASNSSLLRPIILTVFQGTNVLVQNIKMLNSPEWFNLVNEGKNANTDGWDIYRSDQVVIKNSVINNGDDCVSFKLIQMTQKDSTNILVSNLNCTGSHGISVGYARPSFQSGAGDEPLPARSANFQGMFDIVENVTAINIRMSNAQNGARIKAWAGSGVGSGIVKNITFSNFIESKVDNPVVIDQCAQFPSNTFIQDVFFNSISGTSSGSTVASLACSPGARCSDVNVNNFSLAPPSGTAKYVCQNVNLTGNAATLFPKCTVT